MLNTTPTRYQTISTIAAIDLTDAFTAAGIDPAAGSEVLAKFVKQLEPKRSTGEDSITRKRNRKLFEEVVRPYLEQHPEGVTAALVAEGCEGLPVSAEGKTTTQTAHSSGWRRRGRRHRARQGRRQGVAQGPQEQR